VVVLSLRGHSSREKWREIQRARPRAENLPASCLWVELEGVTRRCFSLTVLVLRFQSMVV
jgi:hypothetical protein